MSRFGAVPNLEETPTADRDSTPVRLSAALLTGGADRPYVFGLGTSLMTRVDTLDVIGSDDLDFPEFQSSPHVNFLNLRGSHRSDVSFGKKMWRILVYYAKLIGYAAKAKPKIFHILWNNKFEVFDRTVLMLYYRLLGKEVLLTLHNVNAGKRDRTDTWLNRRTLLIQYRLARRLFVHTEKMKFELAEEFGIPPAKISVIPFGINNAVPATDLTSSDAKLRLGFGTNQKIILFFGNITPYKGLEFLIAAFNRLVAGDSDFRLVIAGKPDRFPEYWQEIHESIGRTAPDGSILIKDSFIPDDEVEVYFKAADVLVLPYRHVYQSGVLFLGQSFGIPAIVSDVGSLKDDILENSTGYVFKTEDPDDLAATLKRYFASDIYACLESHRFSIRKQAFEAHSWETVAQITTDVYADLSSYEAAKTDMARELEMVSADPKKHA